MRGFTEAALRPDSANRYRRTWLREWFRDRFWIVPSCFMLLGAVLAVAIAEAGRFRRFDSWPAGLAVNPQSSQSILALVATSTLTFVGVVFTITLVALQLASAQLSPRVIRTFVRSPVTRLTFGMFLATFTFSVLVLVLEGGLSGDRAQARAVTTALTLVITSLVIFVVYVTATMKLLQVNWVLTAVAEETRRALRESFPARAQYVPAAPPEFVDRPVEVALDPGPKGQDVIGVILSIDRGRLVSTARRHDCVLELVRAVGEYLPDEEPVFRVHGGSVPSWKELTGCVHLGRTRTLHQDPAFGFRQLVDVAIQALSPALNQPTTAVNTIDRLEDLLLKVSRRPTRTGLWVDQDDVVRLVEPVPGWDRLVELSFAEITVYGADSVQVRRRLLACYASLAAGVAPEQRTIIESMRAALEGVAAKPGEPRAIGVAAEPDRLGLG